MGAAAIEAPGPARAGRLWAVVLAAIACLYAAFLAAGAARGVFFFGGPGRETPSDFAAFYAAARMAHAGAAVDAWDWARHGQVVAGIVGETAKPIPWFNPPSFLLLLWPFAFLAYSAAKLAFVATTLAAFALALAWLARRRGWALAALAFPSSLAVGVSGQNGLLTAALVAVTLALLERGRPWAAGLCLGVLTIKPQLGILFPFVLAWAGAWRAFAGAAVSAVALAVLSAAAFGVASWEAFALSLRTTSGAILGDGLAAFGKMQSPYGVVRHAGFGPEAAWALQATWGAALAVAVCRLWRGPAPFELKGAALALGAVLVQPYVFIYDEAILAVPIALLVRLGRRRGVLPGERLGIAAALVLLLGASLVQAHLGLAAAVILAGLVARRALAAPGCLDEGGSAAHNRVA